MRPPKNRPDLRSAVTLIEVLIALGVVAVLGGGAYVTVANSRVSADEAKLQQDVRVINSAIDAYLSSGGDLDGATTPQDVLARLKTRADSTSAPRILGLTGSFLDSRTGALMQTSEEAGSAALRAYYTTVPSPRFITATTGGAGVKAFVFDEAAGAANPTGEGRSRILDQATQSGWVWDFTNRPVAPPGEAQVPVAEEIANPVANPGIPAIQLDPPIFTPAAGVYPLTRYPILLTLDNPNPPRSSRIYYSLNSDPYVLFNTPFSIGPNITITAFCISLDPSRYKTSAAATAVYGVTPLQLAISISAPTSLTYAEAGGAMLGQPLQTPTPATISLGVTVPTDYLSSAGFQIRYTTDGSDPLTSTNPGIGPPFSGSFESPSINLSLSNWGNRSNLPIRAVAVALNTNYFISSPVVTRSVAANRQTLAAPFVSPSNQVVTFSVTVTMSNPATGPSTGMQIRYTTNNTAPNLTNGLLYSSPFSLSSFGVNENRPVRAVTVPSGMLTNWYNVSPETARTYTGPAFIGSGIPSGALVGSAELNSAFNGSVTVAYRTNMSSITYNQNAVINGSLYVPGTPRVAQNSPFIPQWFPTNDSSFANRIYGIVQGQGPSPRVVDLTGPATPTNYVITFNNNSYITGKIFRRIERYTLTPLNVAQFPVKTSSASLTLNGPVAAPLSATNVANVILNTTSVGSVPLLPGTYGNMTANNDSKFVLGNAASPDTPVTYNFDSLQLNSSADLVIVGRVILNVRNGFAINNGSVLGNSANPDWLQINVWNGNVAANSGSSIFGRLYVPGNRVDLNNGSVLTGSVSANALQINSSATVFSLSPAIGPTF